MVRQTHGRARTHVPAALEISPLAVDLEPRRLADAAHDQRQRRAAVNVHRRGGIMAGLDEPPAKLKHRRVAGDGDAGRRAGAGSGEATAENLIGRGGVRMFRCVQLARMNITIGDPRPGRRGSHLCHALGGLRPSWAGAFGNGGGGDLIVAGGERDQVGVDHAVGPAEVLRAETRALREALLALLPPDRDLAAGDASVPQPHVVDELHAHPPSLRDAAWGGDGVGWSRRIMGENSNYFFGLLPICLRNRRVRARARALAPMPYASYIRRRNRLNAVSVSLCL